MLRMMLFIMFFPIAIMYYAIKLVLSLILGFLRLIGFVDTVWRL